MQSKHKHTTLDSDEEDLAFVQQMKEAKEKKNQARKKMPGEIETTPEKDKDNEMEIEGKVVHLMRYSDLPEDIIFYLTEIYPYGNRLFITGVMQNGQSFNLVATEPVKELYFALKSEYTGMNELSPAFLSRAEQ